MSDTTPSWYHGCMSAEEATAICLKVGQNGTFLVRESQGVKGAYTLSMYFEDEVYHHRLATTSGRRVILQSASKEFKSLEKLVEHYMSPREEFLHPLTMAIYPSLVKQFYEENQNWRASIRTTTPLYERKSASDPGVFPHTPIPIPSVPQSSATNESYFDGVAPLISPYVRDGHRAPTSVLHGLPPTSASFAKTSCKSSSAMSPPDEEYWPAPPPPVCQKPAPAIKPKPQKNSIRRAFSEATENRGNDHVNSGTTGGSGSQNNSSSFITFGKADQDANSQKGSRAATVRPCSCVFPSNGVQLVCEIPDGSDDTDGGKPRRRRTLSLEDEKLENWISRNRGRSDQPVVSERKYETVRLPSSSSQIASQKKTKPADQNKKSKLKNFAHFISRIGKSQSLSQNVANHKPPKNVEKKEQEVKRVGDEKTEVEKEDETKGTEEDNSNQADMQQYTPILCKTQFVAITNYNTIDNAMNFTKGTVMAIKGVRVDGWWFCYNKTTQESGWVHMDYLKPISDEKWFEAKPVETTRDYETYQKLDFSDFDSDFDEDNYCRYLIPDKDMTSAGNEENAEQSVTEVTIETF